MVPEVTHTEDGKTTTVNVIAGHLDGIKAPSPTPDSWAANPDHDVAVFTIKMEANATWKLPSAVQQNLNRTLYFYDGESIEVEGQKINRNHLIRLDPNGDIILKNGDKDSFFLLLQGKPIKEPVAQYGPFVMNTEAEIQEAFSDYKRTQFGGWPWPDQEQVHERNKGRFALHADGSEELK